MESPVLQPRRPPAPCAYVSATLDIWPRQYERQFWESATWLESMRNMDTWFLVHATVNNLVVKTYVAKLPPDTLDHLHHFSSLYLALAILHSSLALRGRLPYYRWRTALLVAQRAARFLNLLMDIAAYRRCASRPKCSTFVLRHIQRPGAKFLGGATVRSLIMTTSLATVLIHTAYLRFSFKAQLAVQLAYVAVLLRYMSVASAHLLSAAPFAPSLARVCKAVNRFSLVGLLQPQDVCESPAVAWKVLLLATGLVAFVVPLTITYFEERRTKLRYIEDELGVPAGRGRPAARMGGVAEGRSGVAETAVEVGLLLAVLSECVWALVLQFHVHVAHWALPLHWPGTNMTWYEVLANGAAPVGRKA